MMPPSPRCPICRQPLIKEIYGDGFRCIYPHEPSTTRHLKRVALILFLIAAALMTAACF